jgi:hypothetical protein
MAEDEPVAESPLVFQPLNLENFILEALGLTVKGHPAIEEWQGIGELLATMEHGSPWQVGDWVNFGEVEYGEEYSQALDHRKLSESTCRNYAWVCKKIPADSGNRFVELSFAHHRNVAALSPSEQKRWLKRAIKDGWSDTRLKQELHASENGGNGKLRYFVVVECKSEADQGKVQKAMEAEGRSCKLNVSGKAPTAKRGKKDVTAKRKRAPKMNTLAGFVH